MERWFKTQSAYYVADAKRVYYLSLEFLLGRALVSNIVNLGARGAYTEALRSLGYDLEALHEEEWDAGLGNGGLGRLAACILDSAATLGLPFYGYGIRYEYGIFQQRIVDGCQVEFPDNWLRYGNPWEIPRPDAVFPVRFYGRSVHRRDENGDLRVSWDDTQDVWAMAYDTPGGRLPQRHREHAAPLVGQVEPRVRPRPLQRGRVRARGRGQDALGEHLEGPLPPGRPVRGQGAAPQAAVLLRLGHPPGRPAPLPQVRRGAAIEDLPAKVAIQLNDTHPVLAIPELMRVLVDDERVPWETAWELTQAVFGYTNHTVLPEALETWPAELLRGLLPRHFEIIEEIDRRFRSFVAASGGDGDEERRDGHPRRATARCGWRTSASSAATP